jgi:LCP family protein required for cell wall assembly
VKSRWKKIVLWGGVGLVVAILAAAGGFYWWFHSQVSASNDRVDQAIVDALKETTAPPAASGVAASTTSTLPESPSAMNIVLVGYDKRVEGSKEVTEGRSDTIILVRIDPDQGFVSLLSVPRDTLADIPGYGLYKINGAYAFGGGALLIRTIQSEIGVDLDHYVALNLQGFQALTDALGGVYIDVDRRYLNLTQSWENIDLQPGYQLLNGGMALDYVRFRHDDNIDFGRMARQQQFITAVREQALGWNLTLKVPKLIKALFSNLDTDLSANELIKLAYWVMKLDGGRIKQAEIKAKTGMIHGIFYVLPTDEELASAVEDFYTPPGQGSGSGGGTVTTAASPGMTGTTGVAPLSAAVLSPAGLRGGKVAVVNATGRVGQGALVAVWLGRQGATVTGVSEADGPMPGVSEVQYRSGRSRVAETVAQSLGITQLTQTSEVNEVTVVLGTSFQLSPSQLSAELAAAQAAGETPSVPDLSEWRKLAKEATFSLTAPTYVPGGYDYSFQRAYDIVPKDDDKPAVRVGYKSDDRDLYVGVSESTWLDAPVASPGVQVQGDGVVYTIVGTSTKVDHVWWIRDGVLCWVTNTLFADLDREELLAVAMSTVKVEP